MIPTPFQHGGLGLVGPRGPRDPYFEQVVLLIQGGADASLTLQDLSAFGDTATITDYAEFNDEQPVFGHNSIKTTTIAAAVGAFSSSGGTVRFGRAAGTQLTIECWVYIGTMLNYASSCYFFAWWQGSSRILEVGGYSTNKLRLRNGDGTPLITGDLSTGLHFVQMNIDGNDYTLDLDGTEIYSGTNSTGVDQTNYSFHVASQDATGSSTGPTTEVWATPLRVTRGVLRARGSVPTEAFPTA